jgi:uncharacterized protein with GYD domain
MPAYIALIDWTDQGVRDFKDTVDRYEAAQSAFESLGVRFTDIWWTLGTHDIVATVEAPDDETLAAALLSVAGQGNIRTTTLRAFTREEMRNPAKPCGVPPGRKPVHASGRGLPPHRSAHRRSGDGERLGLVRRRAPTRRTAANPCSLKAGSPAHVRFVGACRAVRSPVATMPVAEANTIIARWRLG